MCMSCTDPLDEFSTDEFRFSSSPSGSGSTLPSPLSNSSSSMYQPIGSSPRHSSSPVVSRGPETRGHDAPDPSSDVPGLVSYLQQMHGLAKKRTNGVKAAKRNRTTQEPRSAPSSRPILPRLNVSAARTNPYPSPSAPQPRIVETERQAHHSSPSAHTYSMARTDERRARRGSWLPARPLDVPASQSLTAHSPGHGRYPNSSPRGFSTSTVPHFSGNPTRSGSGTTSFGPYGGMTSIQPSARSCQPLGPHSGEHHLTSASNMSSVSALPLDQASRWLPAESPAHGYTPPYSASPTSQTFSDSQGTTPLPSPSLTAPSAVSALSAPDDAENQPFVITPEYEAMANAQFEEALRTSNMQASLRRTQTQVITTIYSARSRGSSPSSLAYSGVHPSTGQHYHHIGQNTNYNTSASGSWPSGPPSTSF